MNINTHSNELISSEMNQEQQSNNQLICLSVTEKTNYISE